MTTWMLGTLGFAYEPWRGVFYPEGACSRHFLAYYSQIFNAVELDTTFFGLPNLFGFRRTPSTSRGVRYLFGCRQDNNTSTAEIARNTRITRSYCSLFTRSTNARPIQTPIGARGSAQTMLTSCCQSNRSAAK